MRTLRIAVAASTAFALIGSSAVMATAVGAEDAPPTTVSVDVLPEPVGLYMTTSSQVSVDVQVTDDVGVTSVQVDLVGRFVDTDPYAPRERVRDQAVLVGGTVRDGNWRATIPLNKRNATGVWSTEVRVRDTAGQLDYSGRDAHVYLIFGPIDNFYVKRNTTISGFNVAEPETRGSFVQMSGRLLRLDPVAGYVGYAGKTIHVLFRPAGWTTWIERGTVTTGARGSFANSHTFRVWRDGTWQVRFAGTDYHLPETSGGDFVDVR